MVEQQIQCGLLGGGQGDLPVLSELQRQAHVQIAFVYDRQPGAVGLEIAEILGIPRYQTPAELQGLSGIDYVVVAEPRARFAEELRILTEAGARVLTPSGAVQFLCGTELRVPPSGETVDESSDVEDTLRALERLFDRKELLKFLLEVSVTATGSSAGSIMLYSPEAKELYIAYATGLSERVVRNTRQKLGEGIAGTVALTRRPQLLRLTPDKTLYPKDRDRMDIASAISVPLMWEDRLLGVLNVSSGRGDREHDAKDLDQLNALSRRLSRVLFESLKIQETQLRHREVKFRSTLARIAQQDVPTQQKFSALARYLSELVNAETVEMFLGTREGDWYVLGGSNRWLTPASERLRARKGAVNRAFLEKRCIVLSESTDPSENQLDTLSSVVYCHLSIPEPSCVVALEFNARYHVDEFLLTRDAILLELARFIAMEMRERTLRRKLNAFARISDAAATLLGCRTLEDLGNVLTRVVGDVLECERVSVRLRDAQGDRTVASFLLPPGEPEGAWKQEDEERFEKLVASREPFTLAFLTFEPELRTGPVASHTVLAFPITAKGVFFGGIIAYSKHPADPMEDAVFSDLDRTILGKLTNLIHPVVDAVYERGPAVPGGGEESYATVLENNRQRIRNLCNSEIARADRYHHTFAVVLFRVDKLDGYFKKDFTKAASLADDIARGIQTRTRKTDYACWIDRTTYAMLTLEGGTRIRFLVSRALVYLAKDLSSLEDLEVERGDIHVGSAGYPGHSRTADDLLQEAENSLAPPHHD